MGGSRVNCRAGEGVGCMLCRVVLHTGKCRVAYTGQPLACGALHGLCCVARSLLQANIALIAAQPTAGAGSLLLCMLLSLSGCVAYCNFPGLKGYSSCQCAVHCMLPGFTVCPGCNLWWCCVLYGRGIILQTIERGFCQGSCRLPCAGAGFLCGLQSPGSVSTAM